MMKLKELKIATRLNVILGGLVVLVFVGFGFYVNLLLQRQVKETTEKHMIEQVNDLTEIISVELKGNQDKINLSLHLA